MRQTKQICDKINKMIAKLCISVEIIKELIPFVTNLLNLSYCYFNARHQ